MNLESWEVPEGEGTFDFTELWQRKGEGVQSFHQSCGSQSLGMDYWKGSWGGLGWYS